MVSDGTLFRSGRQFAAWLWLTPKAHSSGCKDRQVDIGKQGEGYLRRLLVAGATAIAAGAPRPRGLLLGGEAAGAQASQTRHHSADQQDRRHRMDGARARRGLPWQRLSGKSEIIQKCRTKSLRSTSSWKMISGVLPSIGHPGSACSRHGASSPAQGRRTGETEGSPPLGSQPAGHQSCKPRWTQGASPTLRRESARLADWDLKTSRAIKGLRIDHRSAGTSAEFRTLLWKSAERPRG
ncbi:transposase [Azospirillum brasilense]|uniref:transposase n=1 Tax=Azospirillum brasilense TaxID=192 RepID=UPI00403F7834